MAWFLLIIYDIVVTTASLLAGALFFCHRRGKERLSERFGSWGEVPDDCYWFHGASVGEMNGLLPIIARVRARFPERAILVTATSTTGLEKAASLATVVRLVPFDARIWLHRALGDLRPRCFIFGETEIWPGLLSELQRRQVPQVMVNARLSENSLRVFRFCGLLFRPLLRNLRMILCSSPSDAQRFRHAGVPETLLTVTGNAKYDRPAVTASPAETRAAYEFDAAPLLVLGSLRPGEEEIWFPVLAELFAKNVAINVIIAPRHLEQVDRFVKSLEALSISVERKQNRSPGSRVRCVILDSMGLLEAAYSAAQLAFVGGSLVDWGGHNPLEATRYGVPVVMGPYCSSVSDIVAELTAEQGILAVRTPQDVRELLRRWLANPQDFVALGERGRLGSAQFVGAVDRVMARLEGLL